MATSVPKLKFSSHARSISLPSSSHPLLANAEEHLQRLKSSEGASSSSHESTCQKLDGLKNLYEYLDDALQLPHCQRVLSSERFGRWEEAVLDGSLRILDICGAVREIYSQMKENVQELESSLRRKRSGEFAKEVDTYMNSKKHLNKMISKCYKELKRAENCSLAVLDDDSDTVHLVNLIKEIQQLSFIVLESTLSFISQSRTSQTKGWSLISKLVKQKGPSCEENLGMATIEKIQVQLQLLNDKKSDNLVQIQNVLKQLEAINSSIQESEEVLEIVFRHLLKTRVSLLNILNH